MDLKGMFEGSSKKKAAVAGGTTLGLILGGPAPLVGHIAGGIIGGLLGYVAADKVGKKNEPKA